MNDPTPPQEQPRIPGVRYRTETRYRPETIVIDGVQETREVAYKVDVPKPPIDWDSVMLRVVTGAAVAGTGLTVAGGVASIGGLLSMTMPAEIGYSVALGFDLTWLACTAMTYVERDRPDRALKARVGGWIALVITMAAIVVYGVVLHHWEVGAVAAAVPALNKYLLDMVIGAYTADVPESTAFWMRQQTARGLARAAVARQLRRIDRHQAYMLAAFGPEAVARATAVTNAMPVQQQGAPVLPGQTQSAVPAAPQPPVPPSGLSGGQPGQPGQAPVPAAPQPPAVPSGQGAPVSGQSAGQASASVPPVTPPPAQPGMSLVGGSIAATVRQALVDHPEWEDDKHLDDLVRHTESLHGADPKLKDTVRRSRDRDINRRKKKTA